MESVFFPLWQTVTFSPPPRPCSSALLLPGCPTSSSEGLPLLMGGLPTLFEPGVSVSLTGGTTTVASSVSPAVVSEVSSPPGSSETGPRSGLPEPVVVLGGGMGGEAVGGVVGGVVVVVLGGAGVVRPSPPGDGVGPEGSSSQAIPSLSSSRLEGSV
jgi:hypothetical protein